MTITNNNNSTHDLNQGLFSIELPTTYRRYIDLIGKKWSLVQSTPELQETYEQIQSVNHIVQSKVQEEIKELLRCWIRMSNPNLAHTIITEESPYILNGTYSISSKKLPLVKKCDIIICKTTNSKLAIQSIGKIIKLHSDKLKNGMRDIRLIVPKQSLTSLLI